jgi:hypothetical protein
VSGVPQLPIQEYAVYSAVGFTQAVAEINASTTRGAHRITLFSNITANNVSFPATSAEKTIIIRGDTSLRSIFNTTDASFFSIRSGNTLILENNAKLDGNARTGNVVYIYNEGTLIMKAGSSVENTKGYGVYVYNGMFEMSGGEISGNTGNGVYVSGGVFTMSGGKISGNTGSGVYVSSGSFNMSGGEISGNTASSGGGVYVNSGAFILSGGTISDNTATSRGGGVYVNSGTFTKTGQSTIYGDTDLTHTAGSAENTAESGVGHAVYTGTSRNRYSTAGPGVNLDSSKNGAAGGWDIGEVPSGLSLEQSLTWISNNAEEGGVYSITITNNETIAPKTLGYSGKKVGITLSGGTTERTVSLSTTGSLFTVQSGVTLTLGANLTLQGRSGNTASLVQVNSSGTLEINVGSKITGNTGFVGGVRSNGTFTMSGGEISENTGSLYAGGVYVESGTFEMSGGEISGNTGAGVSVSGSTFTMSGGEISANAGSGVSVSGGTFTMSNGTISGNTGTGVGISSYSSSSTTFTMSGGEISGNTAFRGGGVYVSGGTFTMSGGEISGNTASSLHGGGVYVDSSGTFTMNDGTISGNTSSSSGGGVYVSGGTFTMSGGEISGNTTYYYGGGVYADSSGTFTKQSSGIIYGSNESVTNLRNTANSGDNYGHAVYVNSSPTKKRNTTAGTGVTLDSTKDGAEGGWEE